MDQSRYQELKRLLQEALELPPGARPAFARDRCGEDAELRSELERLLGAAAEIHESFLERSTVGLAAPLDAAPEFVEQAVGPIRLTGHLARGGMGEVYVGHHERLKRVVAVKTMRADQRLAPGERERFLREAQVLSTLDHPNICRVFDFVEGKQTDFLVLELIAGPGLRESIEGGLPPRRRQQIAEQVCSALAAAHSRGIVHRDVKPDNVKLTEEGEIKVLDFGLARPLGESSDAPVSVGVWTREADAPTPHPSMRFRTRAGGVLGTPGYLSPEQARGEPATAASDMYAFGLLLQQLFTGRPPHPEGLSALALLERARRAETLPPIGLSRDRAALIRRLLSPDPGRRPTAQETLERLRRIRLKPARRLRRAAAAALVVAALAGATKYTVDLRRERTAAVAAREEAEQVAAFLVGLFEAADPQQARGRDLTARALLEAGVRRLQSELADQPAVRARLLHTIGEVHRNRGDSEAARRLLEQALALRRQHLGPRHADVARTLNRLGIVRMEQGAVEDGLQIEREALAIAEAALGPKHADIPRIVNAMGIAYHDLGRAAEAEAAYLRSLAIREEVLGPDHPRVAYDLANLGQVYIDTERFAEAERVLRRALKIDESAYGTGDHADVRDDLANLGRMYLRSGRLPEAEPLLERAHEMGVRVYGPDHYRVGGTWLDRADLYAAQGRVQDAEGAYRRAIAVVEGALGPNNRRLREATIGLGRLLLRSKRPREALLAAQRAVALGEEGAAPLAERLTGCGLLAEALAAQGRALEARDAARRRVGIAEAAGVGGRRLAETLAELGLYEAGLGEAAAARAAAERAWLLVAHEPEAGRGPVAAIYRRITGSGPPLR